MMWATTYTDASYLHDSGVAAYGVWSKCAEGSNEHSARCPDDINSPELAEMFAIYAGVFHAINWWPGALKGVHIVSDCKNAVQWFNYGNWMSLRELHGADPTGLTEAKDRLLVRTYTLLNDNRMRIATRWVKGHQHQHASARAYVNNKVDGLAYKAATGRKRRR